MKTFKHKYNVFLRNFSTLESILLTTGFGQKYIKSEHIEREARYVMTDLKKEICSVLCYFWCLFFNDKREKIVDFLKTRERYTKIDKIHSKCKRFTNKYVKILKA